MMTPTEAPTIPAGATALGGLAAGRAASGAGRPAVVPRRATRPARRRLVIGAGLAVVGLALAGCGNRTKTVTEVSNASGGGSTTRYATVLDERVKQSRDALPALSVPLQGGTKVRFAKGERLRIAFFGFGKGFDYSAPEYRAATEVARQLGVVVKSFDPAGDAQKEVAQIQDVMSSGKYNAAIVYPLAADLDCNLVTKQLPARGIVPVAIGQPACVGGHEQPGLLTSIPDNGTPEVFRAWADEIAASVDGPQKVIALAGPKLDYVAAQAVNAMRASWDRPDSKVELQDVLLTDYSQPDALQKTQDALQRHGDATAVVSMFPEGTQAALSAAKVAGRTDGLRFYDFGANEFGLQQVKSGAVALTVPYYPYSTVKAAIQALVLARRGEEVPTSLENAGHAMEALRPAGAKAMFVTKRNAAAFADTLSEYGE